MIKKIWHDPVGSKVIATGICAILAYVLSRLPQLQAVLNSRLSIPVWVFLAAILSIAAITFLLMKAKARKHGGFDEIVRRLDARSDNSLHQAYGIASTGAREPVGLASQAPEPRDAGSIQEVNRPSNSENDLRHDAKKRIPPGSNAETALAASPVNNYVDVKIANRSDPVKGGPINGKLISVTNKLTVNLTGCRVMIRDAKSFDASKSSFRDGFGLKTTNLYGPATLLAGDTTPQVWLLRIVGDHLEVGDTVGQGILQWPNGDNSDLQVWLLSLSIEAENYTAWNFDMRMSWTRDSNFPEVESLVPLI